VSADAEVVVARRFQPWMSEERPMATSAPVGDSKGGQQGREEGGTPEKVQVSTCSILSRSHDDTSVSDLSNVDDNI